MVLGAVLNYYEANMNDALILTVGIAVVFCAVMIAIPLYRIADEMIKLREYDRK